MNAYVIGLLQERNIDIMDKYKYEEKLLRTPEAAGLFKVWSYLMFFPFSYCPRPATLRYQTTNRNYSDLLLKKFAANHNFEWLQGRFKASWKKPVSSNPNQKVSI